MTAGIESPAGWDRVTRRAVEIHELILTRLTTQARRLSSLVRRVTDSRDLPR